MERKSLVPLQVLKRLLTDLKSHYLCLLLYTFIRNHKQFIYKQSIPQGSCLCEKCENYCLLNKGINKRVKGVDLPANAHEIVEKNCCNSSNDDCMLGFCV